jgi:cell division protein FtsL
MLRSFNLILVVGVLVLGFVIYSLEHRMRAGERAISRIQQEIADERERIRLLEAEWGFLTRPHRVEQLAREHAGMRPSEPWQWVTEAEIPARVPDRPAPNPSASPDDPLAEMLKVLQ